MEKLGETLLDEGIQPGRIAYKIAEEIGMSYRWVMKYLPVKFKNELQSERASAAARHATTFLEEFLKPPKKKDSIVIKSYSNADFVSFTVEKNYYEEFERNSLALEVFIETSILKALESYNEKMKRAIMLKSGGGKSDEEKYMVYNVLSPKA